MAKPVTNPHRNSRDLFKLTACLLLLLFVWQQATAIAMQQTALADCCSGLADPHQHHNHAHMMSESDQSDHHKHLSRCDPSMCQYCVVGCQTIFSHTQLLHLLSIKQAAPVEYTYHFIPLPPLIALYRPPILG